MRQMKTKQIFQALLAVGITALLLRTFAIDSFVVRGDSMSPTILTGDYVFINRLSYLFGEPKRGDIIVVEPRSSSEKIIKRVVGLPDERVEISNADGKIRVKGDRADQGQILSENYINFPYVTPAVGINTIKLDSQEYFVLGDNRYVSIDSRELGPVDKWDIKGRVFFVIKPKLLTARIF